MNIKEVQGNITMINKIKNFFVLFGLSGMFFVSVIILHIFTSMLLYYISGLVLFWEEYDIHRLLYLIVTTTAVISGSVNIDVLSGHFGETASASLDRNRTVAVYCRSGNRSKNAARILAENGYQVVELGTGFRGWVAAGKKIAKP